MKFLPEDQYKIVVDSVPIICIDVIPIKMVGGRVQYGVIKRQTGPEAGKLALIGGRIMRDESITQAISRTLNNDCSINRFDFCKPFSESRPLTVQQYFHNNRHNPTSEYGYDPTKHSISLTYPITIYKVPKPKNEASDFVWLEEIEPAMELAYDQQKIIKVFAEYFT